MPETPDEIIDAPEEENSELMDELENLIRELWESRVQGYIDELAEKYPNDSRFAKKAFRNPEKMAESRQFRRKIKFALAYAAIPYEIGLTGEKPDKETLAKIRGDLMDRYIETIKRQPRRKPTPMRKAVLLSAALHVAGPAGYGATQIDYHDLRRDIADLATAQFRGLRRNLRGLMEGDTELGFSSDGLFSKDTESMSPAEQAEWAKNVQDLIIYRPDLARKYIDEGKLNIDRFLANHGNGFQGRFFIETEQLRGASADDTLEAKQHTQALYRAIKEEMAKISNGRCVKRPEQLWCKLNPYNLEVWEEIELLDRIVRTYGEDQTWAGNYFGDLVRRKYGNCTARTKFNLAIVSDLEWRNIVDVRIQVMQLHQRVVIKMSDDNWYVLDGKVRPLPTADLTGTVLLDENMFIRNYLKEAPKIKYMDGNKDMDYKKTLETIILGLLLAGADDYLETNAITKNLRSIRDLKWVEEEEKKEDTIEVTLETEPYNPDGKDGEKAEGEAPAPKNEEEEPEYNMTRKELIDTRMKGVARLGRKNVKSLEQLRGAEITYLSIEHTPISDLSPIADARLEGINATKTRISDISSLTNAPLKYAYFAETGISDISPLKDAPLDTIDINKTNVSDISALEGKRITMAWLGYTRIRDLSPLQGQPVEVLDLSGWYIDAKTIEIIKDMPLKTLIMKDATIEDPSLLEGLKVKAVDMTGANISDFSFMRNWNHLETARVDEKMLASSELKEIGDSKNIAISALTENDIKNQNESIRNKDNERFDLFMKYFCFGQYGCP